MAKTQKTTADLFDEILFHLWDVSTGSPTGKRAAFEGAVRFSRFLVSELERRADLLDTGATSTFRRGLTIPDSLINAWCWNILEDCRHFQVPPPRSLLTVIYWQLGCTHLSRRRIASGDQTRKGAIGMLASGASLRSVAKAYKVNASTVLRWRNEGPHEFEQEKYTELRQLTNVDRFYPVSWRRHLKPTRKKRR